VRDAVGKDEPLVQHLFDTIANANFEVPQEGQLREYTMNILYRLYQRHPDMKAKIEEVLSKHQESLNIAITSMPDRTEVF